MIKHPTGMKLRKTRRIGQFDVDGALSRWECLDCATPPRDGVLQAGDRTKTTAVKTFVLDVLGIQPSPSQALVQATEAAQVGAAPSSRMNGDAPIESEFARGSDFEGKGQDDQEGQGRKSESTRVLRVSVEANLGLSFFPGTLRIMQVLPDSQAAALSIREGWSVSAVNDTRVLTLAEAKGEIGACRARGNKRCGLSLELFRPDSAFKRSLARTEERGPKSATTRLRSSSSSSGRNQAPPDM